MTNAPGKNFLKVTGILLIIFGAIAAVVGIMGLGLSGAVNEINEILNEIGESPANGLAFYSVVVLIASGFNIFAGIMGVKNCDKPDKAQVCFILGIVLISLQVLTLVLAGRDGLSFIAIIGFVLPVLYLMGAIKNKKVA